MKVFDFKVFKIWSWPFTSRAHLRSKHFLPFESPYMTSYLNSFDTMSLLYLILCLSYLTLIFLGFDLDLWPLQNTLGEKIITIKKPIHDFLSNFYWHHLYILYRFWNVLGFNSDLRPINVTWGQTIVYHIFSVWPWPLALKWHLTMKNLLPFESLHLTFYVM